MGFVLSSFCEGGERNLQNRATKAEVGGGGEAAISGSSVLAVEKSHRWHPTTCAAFRQYQALVETGWLHLKWVKLFTKVWIELENKNSPKSRKKASWV